MRVLYDTTAAHLTGAGVGRYVTGLRSALAGTPGLELVATSAPAGGRVTAGLRRELLYFPVEIARRAGRLRVDLLHCPAPFGPRGVKAPVVLTIQDLIALRLPALFTRVNAWHHRLVVAPAARRATRIVVPTRFTKDEIVDLLGVDPGHIDVTPLGVDDRFAPVPSDPERLAALHGVRGPYVLCVGTLEPRKNLPALLRAFRMVRARRDDVTLVAVGGRGWRDEDLLDALGRETDGVLRLGRVSDEDLVTLYAGASCFAFPSLYEGFGFPPLEAMACGCPVVSSDASCLPEVLGDAAFYAAPADVEGLAAAIETVLDSPERADDLRERGLRRARDFRWDECARLTIASYDRALAEAA